jgi:flavodoxin I
MKVLVTYFSQSGNTEKIAKAICEEVSQAGETQCKKLEDVSANEVTDYDCIFIGSPLHSGDLAQPIKDFLKSLKGRAGQKMAGFITHFAPAYPDQEMDAFTKPLKSTCQENEMEYVGSFDCQGYLNEALHKPVQEKLGLSDEQWAGMVKEMTGKPNADDVDNAKAFVRSLLK